MEPSESVELAGYEFRFDGVQDVAGPNYQAKEGVVVVSKAGKELLTMRPQKRVYLVQKNPTTEADIDAGLFRHLYVALGEPVGNEAWSLRVYYKPFVQWIWMGPLVMMLGGFIAATDRRYRLATRQVPDQGAAAVARG